MAKVFYPNPQRLTKLGFARVADVPAIFDRTHRYQREQNRYLRDRALGQWAPNVAGAIKQGERPAKSTVSTIAAHLAIFVDWCEDRALDWRNLSYDDCLRFQNEMANGQWSPSGEKLTRSTANQRTDEATSFLQWAARHGLRAEFIVPDRRGIRNFTSTSTTLQGRADVRSRTGRLKREQASTLGATANLPTQKEVAQWMNAVRRRRGNAKYLACRFILETGVRLSELVAIETSQIPSREALTELESSGRTVAPVRLVVTKGDRPRTIDVSIAYLTELRTWIDGKRMRLPMLFTKRTGTVASTKLFVSDAKGHEGTPFTKQTIYDCFTEVMPRPKKWHPHFGRHTYACFYVLNMLRLEALAAGSRVDHMGADWINARGQWIQSALQRQLGHLDDETTSLYLRWLTTAVGIGEVAVGWHDFLSGSEATP